MNPIVKKALAAVAIKEGIERIQEARRPSKPSLLARLFKLSLIGGAAYGLFYAYKGGHLQGLMGKARGSSYDSYDSSVTVSRPIESSETNEPVDAPTV